MSVPPYKRQSHRRWHNLQLLSLFLTNPRNQPLTTAKWMLSPPSTSLRAWKSTSRLSNYPLKSGFLTPSATLARPAPGGAAPSATSITPHGPTSDPSFYDSSHPPTPSMLPVDAYMPSGRVRVQSLITSQHSMTYSALSPRWMEVIRCICLSMD